MRAAHSHHASRQVSPEEVREAIIGILALHPVLPGPRVVRLAANRLHTPSDDVLPVFRGLLQADVIQRTTAYQVRLKCG